MDMVTFDSVFLVGLLQDGPLAKLGMGSFGAHFGLQIGLFMNS